jgi:hypothetical protein
METAEKKVDRPAAPHRPVLSTRVPAEIYARIVAAAERNHRSVADEAIRYITHGFAWEDAHADAQTILEQAREEARALLAHAKAVIETNTRRKLERELRRHDYHDVRGVNGIAWFEPGVDTITWIADPKLLDDLLERAATRAIEKIAGRALKPGGRK